MSQDSVPASTWPGGSRRLAQAQSSSEQQTGDPPYGWGVTLGYWQQLLTFADFEKDKLKLFVSLFASFVCLF